MAGALGRWARLSNRARGLVRLLIAMSILAVYGVALFLIRTHGRLDILKARGPLEMAATVPFFAAVYLAIWGLVTAVSGRSWRDLSTTSRICLLVVLTPVVIVPAFAAVVFPEAIVEDLEEHFQWMKMLSPAYRKIDEHVLALNRLEQLCLGESENEIDCDCEHMAEMQRQAAAIRAIIRANPGQANFEVDIALGNGESEPFDLAWVQAVVPDPSLCE